MPDTNYEVEQGESIPSIAKDKGYFWKTLWNYGPNGDLKAKRRNPNVLYEGDVVVLPELTIKEVSKAVDARYKFTRLGEPGKIKIRLLKIDQPRANEDYVLDIEGKITKGKTDGDGQIEVPIPGNASTGKLILRDGKEVYPIRIGNLDPVDTVSGVQQRLNNLGYDAGEESGEMNDATTAALSNFQDDHGLQVTGTPDEATKAKLLDIHQ